ncbi:MAG: MoaD/ThiS family protein [Gammaproteobacteria bacterium]|nr:MoaD/ThiS family protein [Gammaproteobacteria bacterium]
MRIGIPSVLVAYTGGQTSVEATGNTVGELLADLDRQYPGIRFRMVNERGDLRPHMRVFVNREMIDGFDQAVGGNDDVIILQALSGG